MRNRALAYKTCTASSTLKNACQTYLETTQPLQNVKIAKQRIHLQSHTNTSSESQTERKKVMRLFANEIRRLTKQVLLPLRLIKPFRIVVTLRLIIDSGLQKGSMLNHTNSVPRAHLLFSAHCTSLPYQNHVGHSDSKKNRKEISKVLPSANMRKRVSTFRN